MLETVRVVAEDVSGGFMIINKSDFKEGTHKLFVPKEPKEPKEPKAPAAPKAPATPKAPEPPKE